MGLLLLVAVVVVFWIHLKAKYAVERNRNETAVLVSRHQDKIIQLEGFIRGWGLHKEWQELMDRDHRPGSMTKELKVDAKRLDQTARLAALEVENIAMRARLKALGQPVSTTAGN